MQPIDAHEIHGRLSLWLFTLVECKRHLKSAARAKAANTPDKLELQQERMRALQDLGAKNAPPIPEDPLGLNKYQRFNLEHPEYYAFPTYSDLVAVTENAQMLAIIAFCRIWNSGRSASVLAKSNRDTMVNPYRDQMIDEAFLDPAERSKFDALLDQLLQARDKVLAHADATHSRLPDGARLPNSTVYQIDIAHFSACVERLLDKCRPFLPYDDLDRLTPPT